MPASSACSVLCGMGAAWHRPGTPHGGSSPSLRRREDALPPGRERTAPEPGSRPPARRCSAGPRPARAGHRRTPRGTVRPPHSPADPPRPARPSAARSLPRRVRPGPPQHGVTPFGDARDIGQAVDLADHRGRQVGTVTPVSARPGPVLSADVDDVTDTAPDTPPSAHALRPDPFRPLGGMTPRSVQQRAGGLSTAAHAHTTRLPIDSPPPRHSGARQGTAATNSHRPTVARARRPRSPGRAAARTGCGRTTPHRRPGGAG